MKTKARSALVFALAVAVATAIILLSACGGKSESPPASNAASGGGKVDTAGKTLNLLTWEGYADPKFVKGFEDKFGVKVTATYFGSSDELVAKLKGGGGDTFDVISPSSDVAAYLMREDLVAPVNLDHVPNYANLADKLKDMNDVKKDGQIYGIPFTWGPDSLIYDADVIKTPPDSWNIFWDPQYKGKVSIWDDISNIYLIGQMMGLDSKDQSAVYNMTEDQLSEAKKKLIDLKPQIRKYWASAGELNDLFSNKEVVLAVGWPLTPTTVNAAGRNLKETIPKEGITGWIDRLMIVKASKNKDLAETYINYVIDEQVQKLVADATGYGVANKNAAKHMSAEQAAAIHIDDMDNYMAKINFWQEVKDRNRYNEIWNEVKAQ